MRLTKVLGDFDYVRFPNPTEVNRSIGIRLSLITERSIDYAGAHTRLIRTPVCNGEFSLCRRKPHIFSQKLICLVRTMSVSHKLSFIFKPVLRTLGLPDVSKVYFPRYTYVLIVDIVPCSNNH